MKKKRKATNFGMGQKARLLLELVLQLAIDKTDKPQSVECLSNKIGCHSTYIHRLAKQLRSGGIIDAVPGVNGGYTLRANPEDITVMDLIRSSGDGSALYPCLEDFNFCQSNGKVTCKKIAVLQALNDRIVEAFSSVTIADIIHENAAGLNSPAATVQDTASNTTRPETTPADPSIR